MKKFRMKLLTALFLLIPCVASAAGTWETPIYSELPDAVIRTITLEWTADAAAATVPNYSFTATDKAFVSGWNLFMVITDPDGTTAPTDDYDITILDQYGVDVSGGQLADRDTANTEQIVPAVGAGIGGRTLDGGAMTVTVGNNSVNSASGKIILFLGR